MADYFEIDFNTEDGEDTSSIDQELQDALGESEDQITDTEPDQEVEDLLLENKMEISPDGKQRFSLKEAKEIYESELDRLDWNARKYKE